MSTADDDRLEITGATLGAPADVLDDVGRFYGELWGLPVERTGTRLAVTLGRSRIAFEAAAGAARPFYHFAALVPGDRFGPALDWLRERAAILRAAGTGDEVFDFGFWDALACYCHDPAGNIVELIAHAGVEERGEQGPFSGSELRGLSELGLVVEDAAGAIAALEGPLGLELWDGSVPGGEKGLAFVGRKAYTLIVCGPGRGWLPTGRPAEVHQVDVTISGAPARSEDLPGAPVRVRRAAG